MTRITLTTGDWSHDGCCKTDDYCFEVNCSRDELMTAWRNGMDILGLAEESYPWKHTRVPKFGAGRFCELSKELVDKLVHHGVLDRESDNLQDQETLLGFTPELDQYVEIWLHIAKLGAPYIVWNAVADSSIAIGGYGLYY